MKIGQVGESVSPERSKQVYWVQMVTGYEKVSVFKEPSFGE